MSELKPCPFCGKQPVMNKSRRWPFMVDESVIGFDESVIGFNVHCDSFDCPIFHADKTYYLSEEAAALAWNRRAYENN